MTFLRFIFSFLYIRNWHSGKMEVSRPRLLVFLAALFLLGLAAVMIIFLQTPIMYAAP